MIIFDTVEKLKLAILETGQTVKTKNYSGVVGGAEYEIVTLTNFTNEFGDPDGFSDFALADPNIIAKIVEPTPDLFQLGLVEGNFDNAPALTAAFEGRHRTIVAQDGTIQIQSPVVADVGGKHLVNIGQGRRSIFNYTTATASITLNVADSNSFITIAGLGLTASANTNDSPLTINYPFQATNFRRQVTLVNLDVVSLTDSAFAFADGIVLNNVWLTNISNCTIQGDLNDITKQATGVTLKGQSVGTTIDNCQMNHVSKGVLLSDTSSDLVIGGCRITVVEDCVNVGLSSSQGRLVVSDSSLSSTDNGVITNNIDNIVATGNRINKTGSSTSDYRDFFITNATGAIINDNITSGAGASGTDISVEFVNVDKASIHDNVMQERPTLITLDATTTRVSGEGNVGDVGSTTVVDSGAGNNITDAF